jgi:proton glutamate symport protein
VSAAPATARPRGWRLPSLTTQIFIGLLLGILIGFVSPGLGVALKPLADIFLRMIKMIIAPLIFSTLVVGIAGTGDIKEMGRIGVKALLWFTAGTVVALTISLVMVNAFQPGANVHLDFGERTDDLAALAGRQQGGWDILVHVVPTSVIDAMARGDILQIVVFATVFGIALSAIGEKGAPVVAVLDGLAHVMFRFTAYVMLFAPVGVLAAIAATVGGHGIAILVTLGKLVVVMYGALVIYVLVAVIGAALLVRVPIGAFFRAIREPFLIAFTTASSEAALPKALEAMERFGAPKRIVGFVLPTGYSLNLDGSTLYLAAASLFVAQLAGIELGIGQQLLIMLTLLLTSKGVAGVPRAALVILTGTLQTFGLPLEGAALLLGVDQVLDMGRTAVNVMGNCIATVVVARWEGVFDDDRMRRTMMGAAGDGLEQA